MENPQQRLGKPEDIIAFVQSAVDQKEKERDVHWTVKVFGGALLSVTAIVVIGAFQSAFQSINECQKSLQQQSSTVLSKDEYNIRTKAVWDSLKDCGAQKTEIAALKERVKLLEQQVRDLNMDLQKLRDRIPPQKVPSLPQ
jgi:cell division protein FtsB